MEPADVGGFFRGRPRALVILSFSKDEKPASSLLEEASRSRSLSVFRFRLTFWPDRERVVLPALTIPPLGSTLLSSMSEIPERGWMFRSSLALSSARLTSSDSMLSIWSLESFSAGDPSGLLAPSSGWCSRSCLLKSSVQPPFRPGKDELGVVVGIPAALGEDVLFSLGNGSCLTANAFSLLLLLLERWSSSMVGGSFLMIVAVVVVDIGGEPGISGELEFSFMLRFWLDPTEPGLLADCE